jgi:phosphoribosylanthranilate isomerase
MQNEMTIIKICGIKTLADAQAAIHAGADYLGFNFYPGSVRCIDIQECAGITSVLKEEFPAIKLVGVFVDAAPVDIQAVLQTCQLDLAQLHGNENPQVLIQLAPYAFKALRGIPANVDQYIRQQAPACLVDAVVQGAYGGTGVTADWPKAAAFARQHAIFLAGGLQPENVASAISRVKPWGVDVASGVESTPGVKDIEKMRSFIQAVRSMETADPNPQLSEPQ